MSADLQSSKSTDYNSARELIAWATAALDPEAVARTYGGIRAVGAGVINAYRLEVETTGRIAPTERAAELTYHALHNTQQALQSVRFGGDRLELDARLNFATHEKTVAVISDLANHSEEAMASLIGDYPGGQPALSISPDGTHLSLARNCVARPSKFARACPYAKHKGPDGRPEAHPLMQKFAPWAGQIAVHLAELRRK